MGGERAGDRLGADARRVVTTGVGVQLGGQAVAGVLEVHVGGAHRRHARLPLGRHPEHPAADRPAHPLLAGPRVEGASERADVEPDRADALGAVQQDRDVQRRQSGRATEPWSSSRASRQRAWSAARRRRRGRRRAPPGRDAAPLAQRDQRAEQAGVLVRRGEHLVPGPSSIPASTRTRPSLVHVVRATSARAAPRPPRRRRAGARAARASSRRTPSCGPVLAAAQHGERPPARPPAAAARTSPRSGRPDPRGRGTRSAGRRHPPPGGYHRPQTGHGRVPARA